MLSYSKKLILSNAKVRIYQQKMLELPQESPWYEQNKIKYIEEVKSDIAFVMLVGRLLHTVRDHKKGQREQEQCQSGI